MVDPAWVALSLTRHLGGKTFKALLAAFNYDLPMILAADTKTLRQVTGVGPKIAQAIQQIDLKATEIAMRRWYDADVRIIPQDSPEYPQKLKRIDDSPPTLFVLGALPGMHCAYAIIGTRNPSPASQNIASELSAELVRRGDVVVSGLALGVDTLAHMGALAVPGGQTLAVLGSGVLNVYPQQNRALAAGVVGRGALLCEVAPDAEVSTPGLVARNRIITGLCDGVIVVETEVGGGAMHAARFARVQGVPIYVVKNNASGNLALLKQGALPVARLFD